MKRNQLMALFMGLFLGTLLFAPVSLASEQEPPVPTPAEAKKTTPQGWPSYLRLLTGPNGGQWFDAGEILAIMLDRDIMPTTSRIGGGMDNISVIHNRMGDLGFTVASFLFGTKNNLPEFEGVKIDNVATLGNVYPQIFYMLTRKGFAENHNLRTIEDLLNIKGVVRMASLRPGSASEFVLSNLLKYGYGTSFEELRLRGWTVAYGNYSAIADDLVAGTLDCFAYTAGEDVPLIHTLTQHIPITILQVDVSAIDNFSKNFGMYAYTIPAHRYTGQDRPVTTLGDYTTIIVRKDFPDDLVYAITKVMFDNKKFVAQTIHDFGALSPKTAISNDAFLHPGAALFWKEQL